MNTNKDIQLISDSSFVYRSCLLLFAVFVIVVFILFFFLFFYFALLALLFILPLFYYYINILKNRKVEIYKNDLSIKVSSYFDAHDSFFLSLKKVDRIDKIFPGWYKFLYYEENVLKMVFFKSIDFNLKFLIPFSVFFENNSKVTYLVEMVNYAKNKE